MSLGITASSAASLVLVEGVEVAVGRVRGEIGGSAGGDDVSPAVGGSSWGISLVSDADVCDRGAGEVVGVVCGGGPVEGAGRALLAARDCCSVWI